MRLLHILGGLLALTSGAVALSAGKGGELHRRAGIAFVYAMLFVSASGAAMATLRPSMGNVISGVLTFYLVLTSLLTVRPVPAAPWIVPAATLVALALGLAGAGFGLEALASESGSKDGHPAALYFLFGGVALLAALGDLRWMRAPRPPAAHRIARHLWRMCFALFNAAGAFFLGAKLFPSGLRHSGVMGIPVLGVALVMLYWLARVAQARRLPLPVR